MELFGLHVGCINSYAVSMNFVGWMLSSNKNISDEFRTRIVICVLWVILQWLMMFRFTCRAGGQRRQDRVMSWSLFEYSVCVAYWIAETFALINSLFHLW